MTRQQRKIFFTTLNNTKIFALKSHDCHILIQHLLPLAIRNILPDNCCVGKVLLELCYKRLNILDLDKLQHQILLTLSYLKILLPSLFFTVMMLGHLKSFMRNRAHYQKKLSQGRIEVDVLMVVPMIIKHLKSFTSRNFINFHSYLIRENTSILIFATKLSKQSYVEYIICVNSKHLLRGRQKNQKLLAIELEKIVSEEFGDWFLHRVTNPNITNVMPDEIKYLARGPMTIARRYTAYNINGYKYRTLMGRDEASCVASKANAILRLANLRYYRKFEDIIELNYYGVSEQILHKGCLTIYFSEFFSQCIHKCEHKEDDPYIEALQAQMIYYVDDECCCPHMSRDLYDMGEVREDITFEIENGVDDEFVTISHVENQLQGDANICLVVHLTKPSLFEYHILTHVQVVMPPKANRLKNIAPQAHPLPMESSQTFVPPLSPNQQPHIPPMAPTQQSYIPPKTHIP
ncbi:hypothetical protein CR513_28736, partial [Mucuna pruriens]